MSIRVLLADDHEVVRTGLKSLLEDTSVDIIAEASSGEEAVKKAAQLAPDVILLDIRLGEFDGLQALEKIRKKSPQVKVVMLSTYDNPTYVARSVALGASDYVLKDSPRESLVAAIERAAAGSEPSDEGMLSQVKQTMARRGDRHEDIPLTNRELQVLRHLALGLSNKEIGRSLNISVETVKEHVQNVLRKLDVADRTQAAVWAVKRGLVG